MKTSTKVIIGVLYAVVLAAGFFGGVMYQKHKTPVSAAAARGSYAAGAGTAAAGGARRGGAAGGFAGAGVTGQIVSMDSSSITVKTANGSTEIVYYSSTTPITKQAAASASDLTTGANVVVRGSSSNGTVTATNISVVPTLPTPPAGANGAPMMPAQ